MSLKLKLIDEEESGLALIAAEGQATAADFPSGDYLHLDTILGAHWARRFVALDMDQVSYIDSSAIGWLLGVHKAFRVGGGKIALHSVQPQVRQVLELLKINRVVPLAADLAAARAAILPAMTAAHGV